MLLGIAIGVVVALALVAVRSLLKNKSITSWLSGGWLP